MTVAHNEACETIDKLNARLDKITNLTAEIDDTAFGQKDRKLEDEAEKVTVIGGVDQGSPVETPGASTSATSASTRSEPVSTPGTVDDATAAYRAAVLTASQEFLAALYKIAGEDVTEPFCDPGPHYDAADLTLTSCASAGTRRLPSLQLCASAPPAPSAANAARARTGRNRARERRGVGCAAAAIISKHLYGLRPPLRPHTTFHLPGGREVLSKAPANRQERAEAARERRLKAWLQSLANAALS